LSASSNQFAAFSLVFFSWDEKRPNIDGSVGFQNLDEGIRWNRNTAELFHLLFSFFLFFEHHTLERRATRVEAGEALLEIGRLLLECFADLREMLGPLGDDALEIGALVGERDLSLRQLFFQFRPFFGQRESLRVGYLDRDDAFGLLVEPDSDFDLDFEEALLEEIYRLTYGQPYLLQRIAWELVEAWNDRFEKSREVIPRTLRLPELEPLLDADFYAAAGYYFEGLWERNVTADERRLMTVLARREEPWAPDEIAAQVPAGIDLAATLEQLRGHYVLLTDPDGRIRFAAQLLRRWVAREKDSAAGLRG